MLWIINCRVCNIHIGEYESNVDHIQIFYAMKYNIYMEYMILAKDESNVERIKSYTTKHENNMNVQSFTHQKDESNMEYLII